MHAPTFLFCSDLLECRPRECPELLPLPLGSLSLSVRQLQRANRLTSTFPGSSLAAEKHPQLKRMAAKTVPVAWTTATQVAVVPLSVPWLVQATLDKPLSGDTTIRRCLQHFFFITLEIGECAISAYLCLCSRPFGN